MNMTPAQMQAYATQVVAAQLAAAAKPIQDQQAHQAQLDQQHQDAIRGFAQAVAQLEQPIGPAVSGIYNAAAGTTGGLAKGLSDSVQGALSQDAASQNAFLKSMGAPDSAAVNPQIASPSYELGGFLPGKSLAEQGAGFGAQAAMLPAQALGRGAQDANIYSNTTAAANSQKFMDALNQMQAQRPQLYFNLMSQLQDAQTKGRAQALNQQIAQQTLRLKVQGQGFNQKATVARIGIEQQNANTSARRAAQSQLQSNRQYQVALAGLGIRQRSQQLRALMDEQKLQSGGFTPEKVQKFKAEAYNIAITGFQGGTVTGATYQSGPNKGKPLPTVSYRTAISHARSQGIPLSIAIPALNEFYKPGMRGRPRQAITVGGGGLFGTKATSPPVKGN